VQPAKLLGTPQRENSKSFLANKGLSKHMILPGLDDSGKSHHNKNKTRNIFNLNNYVYQFEKRWFHQLNQSQPEVV
jgi:hypothetical protein